VESQGGYLSGHLGGSVTMSEWPPNYHVYTECIVTGVLQSFYTSNYFTQDQLEGDMCPLLLGLCLIMKEERSSENEE
jgi:hypothetical protein